MYTGGRLNFRLTNRAQLRIATGRTLASGMRIILTAMMPCAVLIDIVHRAVLALGILGGVGRLIVRAVGILQLGRRQIALTHRELNVVCLIVLVSRAGGSRIHIDYCPFRALDGGATDRSVDIAIGGNRAFNCYLCIFLVATRYFAGSNPSSRNEVAGDELQPFVTYIWPPFIKVIEIECTALHKGACSTVLDVYLSAGKKGNLLLNRNFAAVDINSDIAVYGQHEIGGAHRDLFNGHADACNIHSSVNIKHKTISVCVVTFGNRSTLQVKHCVLGRYKLNAGAESSIAHINSSITTLGSSCLQSERHHNILNIVIAQGEYGMFGILRHSSSHRTAAEIFKLENFIHFRAIFGSYSARTINITIAVESTTAIDSDGAFIFALSLHNNITIVIQRGSATAKVGATDSEEDCIDVHGTAVSYGNARTRSHGQGFICRDTAAWPAVGPVAILTLENRCCAGECTCIIAGDKQSNTAGNGVVPRNRTVIHQNNDFATTLLRRL